MPRERFTYTVDYPGLRAPGLDVGRLIASFDVTDYTGSTEDRALAMRELVAAAVTMACRRLAAEEPELLQSRVAVSRAEGSLTLRLPSWFQGAPPESVVRLVSDSLANAASQAAGPVLADLAATALADLDPEEKAALKQTYEAAEATLRQGKRREGMRLLNQAEQQRAWHRAALEVAGDVPAVAGAVRRAMPPQASARNSMPVSQASTDVHASPRNSMHASQDATQAHATPRKSMLTPQDPMPAPQDATQAHATPHNSVLAPQPPRQLHASPRNPMPAPQNPTPAPQNSAPAPHNSMPAPQPSMQPLDRSAQTQASRPNALIDPPTPDDATWLADLAREAELLLWAPGPAESKAVLLAAILGPLPPELLAVPFTARPPQAPNLTKQQAQAATRAIEAYLAGQAPAEALQPKRGRKQ